jgi:hypothetical protein
MYFSHAEKKKVKLKHKLCSFVLSCCLNKKERFDVGHIRNYASEIDVVDLKKLYIRH